MYREINLTFPLLLLPLGCIIFLFIIGKIFVLPIKFILKLIGNSIIGGILIFIVNLVGSLFGFHIGLNIITAIVTGILGIPGVVLLCFLKFL